MIALLDKSYPPEHSFVDGMLAREVPGIPGQRVRLVVSAHGAGAPRPGVYRYGRTACLTCLRPRRGIGRWWNFLLAARIILAQRKRENQRGRAVCLFVRNDPLLLLAAALMRGKANTLVYQSSFPHERVSGGRLKCGIARALLALSAPTVDATLAVSPVGSERLRRLFPNTPRHAYIPLLADSPADVPAGTIPDGDSGRIPTFIYLGTHAPKRQLEVVIRAIGRALNSGLRARFIFVGGSQEEMRRLGAVIDSTAGAGQQGVEFHGRLPRQRALEQLRAADVGLSVAPPLPENREMSPTKLTEYMGYGLAVIATRGIPLQETIVTESGGGLLVDWNEKGLAEAFTRLATRPDERYRMGAAARDYARLHLQYASYTDTWKYITAACP